MLYRKLLSVVAEFLGNLPRKGKLSTLVGGRMYYSIMKVLATVSQSAGQLKSGRRKPGSV